MSAVVISGDLVLSGAIVGDAANGNNPLIGYHNLVTTANITSDTEAANHPIIDVANPATHLFWRGVMGSPSDEFITVEINSVEDVDYIAAARHNFFTGLFPVTVEGQATDGGDWFDLVAEVVLPNDGPVIFRFTPQSLFAVRLRIRASTADTPVAPEIGVIYVGRLLILQRRIYVGHTPLPYGRQVRVVNGRSESGNFLGRIVTGESRQTQVNMENLTPDWYRTYMEPFVRHAVENPFFFAWRPLDYPYEAGFAWLTADAVPNNQRVNGMMQVSLQMGGVA